MTQPVTVAPAGLAGRGRDLLPRSAGERRPAAVRAVLERAELAADRLAVDAVQRDRANRPPRREFDLLKELDLMSLVVPAELGGAGADYRAAFEVVRIIARVDPSIAQVLGYHYDISNRILEAGDRGTAERVMREVATRQWLLGTSGASPERRLIDATGGPDRLTLTGRRIFATGSGVADRLRGYAVHRETGRRLVILIDPGHPSVTRLDDWDFLGQRLSASSGFVLEGYPVAPDDVIASYPAPAASGVPGIFEYHQPLTVQSQELVFSYVYLGIAEGALDEARDYVRQHSRPFAASGLSDVLDDPHIQRDLGELVARTAAAGALVREAEAELEAAYGLGTALGEQQVEQVTAVVSAAKSVTERAALDAGHGIFAFMGARSARSEFGHDRFWRNVRTLSLHDPINYHLARVGRSFLGRREQTGDHR